jgi:hypothetical protein
VTGSSLAHHRRPQFSIGVDLGQAGDFTAIVICRLHDQIEGEDGRPAGLTNQGQFSLRRGPAISSVFDVVRIERTRGTSYSEIAERVVELVNGPHLLTVRSEMRIKPALAVDPTGTGRPVVDELRKRGLNPEAIQLTAGTTAAHSNGYYNVPKRDLTTQLIVAFQNGWVRIAEGVDHAEQLKHELLNYRWKVKLDTGNETLEAWRERDHDDIVLGLAMAVQAGVRPRSAWRDRTLVGFFDGQGCRVD